MLAPGWSVSAFGRILQMILDKSLRHKRIQVRFAIAAGLAFLAWSVADVPYLACADPTSPGCTFPLEAKGQFLFAVAGLTFILGLTALFLPTLTLKALGLQTRINKPFARGETRGTLAGFNIAVGGTYLFMPQPVDFVALVLGGAWLLAGVGRLISVLMGRDWSIRNAMLLFVQTGIGALCIAIVLRMI